jgi:hypothetical protein
LRQDLFVNRTSCRKRSRSWTFIHVHSARSRLDRRVDRCIGPCLPIIPGDTGGTARCFGSERKRILGTSCLLSAGGSLLLLAAGKAGGPGGETNPPAALGYGATRSACRPGADMDAWLGDAGIAALTVAGDNSLRDSRSHHGRCCCCCCCCCWLWASGMERPTGERADRGEVTRLPGMAELERGGDVTAECASVSPSDSVTVSAAVLV